jgi:hypothetical protein
MSAAQASKINNKVKLDRNRIDYPPSYKTELQSPPWVDARRRSQGRDLWSDKDNK